MASIDDYWKQISASDRFKDLSDDEKEKVRSHLWDKYVQASPSYQNLPLTQRNEVLSHFNETTAVKPEGFMEKVERKAKPVIAKGKELLGKASTMVDVTKLPSEMEEMGRTSIDIPGEKQAAAGARDIAGRVAGAIEPSSEAYGRFLPGTLRTPIQAAMTPFDMARAIGSGAVRGAGELLAGLYEGGTMGAALLAAPVDAVAKYAGLTFPFLSKERHLPGWKPKTGLSVEANSVGDQFEKIVTKRRIENNARQTLEGPPKPLEVLAQKEAVLKTQNEFQAYEDWLKQADQTSARGGEPQGDIYPDAKTNVSQLRDAAKERLQKLQDEPVRVESLSKAEDELQGYYRRRIDREKVYLMPEGEVARQEKLPAGPEPPKQITAGPGSLQERPAPKAPPITPGAKTAPVETPGLKAKEVMTRAYAAYHPEQTRQAIGIRVGAALKAFGFKANEELSADHVSMVEKFLEQEHADYLKQTQPTPRKAPNVPSRDSEMARLREKGLDPIEVTSEAKRLQEEHESMRGIRELENAIKSEGGLAMNPQDPSGRIPEQEEYLRNVPIHLRGNTTPDQMAQALYEQGFLPDASSSSLYRKLSERRIAGAPRSARSFMDEAEHNIEHQKQVEAGFQEDLSLRGEKAGEAGPVEGTGGVQAIIPGTESKFPDQKLKDIKNESTFNIVSDIGRHFLDERGQLGGGDVDPVRQAALEAAVNELVDRAMALGYQTTQDIMVYAARNAPKELQNALRKNLAPTLSSFDDHAYKEMDEAKKGNAVAKKSMSDSSQRSYLAKKADIIKGTYQRFKANQQIAMFKDGDEGSMRLQNEFFIHDNYRKFSKDELAAQRWFIEGKSPKLESLTSQGIPEEQAQRWLNLAKNPTENMKKARSMTQVFEDEYYQLLTDFYDEVGYRDDHVTRRWKRPEQYLDWEGRTLSNRPNFLKGAKLLSQAQGIDAGFEPVSWDIKDDLRASNNARVNILSRVHAYQKLGVSMAPDGPAMMDESAEGAATQARNAKLTPHRGEAPPSWLRFPAVPLLRDIAINPYYKEVVQYMMARPFQFTGVETINFAGAVAKASKLIGLFHGYTEEEMILSGINYRNLFSFSKDRNTIWRFSRYIAKSITADMEGEPFSKNPIKAVGQLYKSFMNGHGALANRPLALDMVEHNFKISGVDDDVHSILSRTLLRLENGLADKIGGTAAKAITVLPRHAIDLVNKSIFDYQRVIGSMIVYEDNLADAIKKYNLDMPEGRKMPIEEIKKQISSQTSNAMGGLTYAQFMAHPKTQQMLQWLMLAPQWTIGRVQMAGATMLKGPQGNMARKQMAKLFIGWYFVSNAINYANTKKYLGKGRYMSENPEGYRDQAFRKKDKDGTTYYQISKALTEIADDFEHPFRTFTRKTSPYVQAATKLMNWGGERFYYANPYEKPPSPLATMGEAFKPMFMSGQSAYGGLPMHKGPSKDYVMGMLDQYYSGGMKDARLYQRALQVGLEQGYNVGKLDQIVRSNRSRERNRALFR